MNRQQFDLIAELLRVTDPLLSAVRDVVLGGRDQGEAIRAHGCRPDAATATIDMFQATELSVRSAFVLHRAAEWEVVVGHNDYHRRPGSIQFRIGQTICLICRRTYIRIPARIVELSKAPSGYHRGVICEPIDSMHYSMGDSVAFGEEQVLIPSAPLLPPSFRTAHHLVDRKA